MDAPDSIIVFFVLRFVSKHNRNTAILDVDQIAPMTFVTLIIQIHYFISGKEFCVAVRAMHMVLLAPTDLSVSLASHCTHPDLIAK